MADTCVCVWGGLCIVGSLAPPWPPPTRCSTAPPGVTTKHSLGVRVALTENQGTGKYAHNFLPVALSLWILFLAHVALSGIAGWKGDRCPSGSSRSTARSPLIVRVISGRALKTLVCTLAGWDSWEPLARGSFPLACWSRAATSQCQCLSTLTNCLRVPLSAPEEGP